METEDPIAKQDRSVAELWADAMAAEASADWVRASGLHAAIVRRDPSQIAAWLRLSVLEQRAGRYLASRQRLLDAAAAAMATPTARQIGFLCQRLLAFDEHALVARLIERVPRDSREWLAQSAVLAQQLSLIDRDPEALALLDEVAAQVVPGPLLDNARATALRNCGRLDDAAEAFEQALLRSPSDARAHWSLAHLQPSRPPGARVARVRTALATVDPASADVAYLQYALFKELDDAGQTAEAWDALCAGARRARAGVRHDAAREAEAAAMLRSQIPFGAGSSALASASATRTPVFVVGMPRTGTTVLERILDNHPAIRGAGELHDFRAALCMVADRFLGAPLEPGTVEQVARVDLAAVGRAYLQRTNAVAAGARVLVDKNPTNVFHAGAIARALPGARIVCLVRNPMDACFSNLKELFAGGAHAYSYRFDELAAHYACFRGLVSHWQAVLGGQFMTVGYEALVSDPAAVMQGVMAFIGVPYDASCIDITRNPRASSTASSAQIRAPIHGRGVDAWTRYADELAPLQAMLARALPEPPHNALAMPR